MSDKPIIISATEVRIRKILQYDLRQEDKAEILEAVREQHKILLDNHYKAEKLKAALLVLSEPTNFVSICGECCSVRRGMADLINDSDVSFTDIAKKALESVTK